MGEAAVRATIAAEMSGERGGMISRGLSAAMDPEKDMTAVVMEALGFKPKAEMQKELEPAFENLRKILSSDDFKKRAAAIGALPAGERGEAIEALLGEQGGLRSAYTQLRGKLDKAGVKSPDLDGELTGLAASIEKHRDGKSEVEEEKKALARSEKRGKEIVAAVTLKPGDDAEAGQTVELLKELLEALKKIVISGELTFKGGNKIGIEASGAESVGTGN